MTHESLSYLFVFYVITNNYIHIKEFLNSENVPGYYFLQRCMKTNLCFNIIFLSTFYRYSE